MSCKFQNQFLKLQQIFKFIISKECRCEGRRQRLCNPFFLKEARSIGGTPCTWRGDTSDKVTRSTNASSDRNMHT